MSSKLIPILSIVIATKNREFYCIEAIKSILAINSHEIQLTIADNSDTLAVKEFVETISDSRLIYQYNNNPTSSIENFNRCIELATGQYICMIGDDDIILDNIIIVAKWAKENDIDSVCPKVFINYLWPEGNESGKLVIPSSSKKIWRNIPLNNIQKLIDDGAILYTKFNLPKVYHGIIKKELLNKIKEETGNYFGGLSPDIYSSVALSKFVKKNIVIDFPLTIAGACPSSTTKDNKKGKHSGRIEDAFHLKNRGLYKWDKLVPKFYSVETIWAESALKAIQEVKIENIKIENINIKRIVASALNTSPSFKKLFFEETLKVINKNEISFNFKRQIFLLRFLFLFKLIISKVLIKFSPKTLYQRNIENIEIAKKVVAKFQDKDDINQILRNYKNQTRKI